MSTTPTTPAVVAAPLAISTLATRGCLAELETGCRAERQRVVGVGLDVGEGPHEHLTGWSVADHWPADVPAGGANEFSAAGAGRAGSGVKYRKPGGSVTVAVVANGPGPPRALAMEIERFQSRVDAGAGEILQTGGGEVDVLPREVRLVERSDDHVVDVERRRECRGDLRCSEIGGSPATVWSANARPTSCSLAPGSSAPAALAWPNVAPAAEQSKPMRAVDDQVASSVGAVVGIGVVDRDVGDPNAPTAGEGVDRRSHGDLADVGGEQVELVQPRIEHRRAR